LGKKGDIEKKVRLVAALNAEFAKKEEKAEVHREREKGRNWEKGKTKGKGISHVGEGTIVYVKRNDG